MRGKANRNLTTGENFHTDMEETFAENLDELIHKIMKIYQRKFGEKSELDEPKTEEYIEQRESQPLPTRNNYEALATDDSDVEDMQEGTNDEIPENTKEVHARPQSTRKVQTQGRTNNK
ncbi:hypothetical protein Trydic_g9833 [Trypoxylus dichotomus]